MKLQIQEKLLEIYEKVTIDRIVEQFKINTEIKEDNECWPWKGKVVWATNGPYGYITFNGESIKTHQLSYLLFKGFLKSGRFVCHKCNNSICVNPNHLYLGTRRSNMLDMAIAGTGNIKRIITQEKIEEMRKFYLENKDKYFQKDVAKIFNVSQPYFCRLINQVRRPR